MGLLETLRIKKDAGQERFTLAPVGDCAVLAVFEQRIDTAIGAEVAALNAAVQAAGVAGILETVPAYASLMIYYDPLILDYEQAAEAVRQAGETLDAHPVDHGRLVEIPVCYGGTMGPDIGTVARHAGLSIQDVISLHTGREYRIYMLGFLPGFPYLGGLDERLYTPRLDTPRTSIPAGSVGIGGEQTGIYPIASPGGWQLIGRTPMRLYRPDNNGQLPYAAGDRIRFRSITQFEYDALAREEGSV